MGSLSVCVTDRIGWCLFHTNSGPESCPSQVSWTCAHCTYWFVCAHVTLAKTTATLCCCFHLNSVMILRVGILSDIVQFLFFNHSVTFLKGQIPPKQIDIRTIHKERHGVNTHAGFMRLCSSRLNINNQWPFSQHFVIRLLHFFFYKQHSESVLWVSWYDWLEQPKVAQNISTIRVCYFFSATCKWK